MPYCNDQFYRYYDGGAGAYSHPTILIHGLGGSHLSWPARLRRMSGQNIFALDLPGHGKTTAPACVEMPCHIQALKRFIHCMHLEQINLIGHSMGAMIAIAYAGQFPKTVHTLSLLSVGERVRFAPALEQAFRAERTKEKGIEILLEKGFHRDFPKLLRKKIIEPLYGMRRSLLHADAQVGVAFNPAIFSTQHDIPTLLISGADDEFVPRESARALARRFSRCDLHLIQDCGHFVLYEKEDAVRETLANFLRQHESTVAN